MIRHKNLTLSGTAVEVSYTDEVQEPNQISIENTSSSGYAYIGTSAVTTSSYGFKLFPGQTLTMDLNSFDVLYACGDSGVTIAVMVVEL